MIRMLFLVHRYLGIAMGLLISLWCLSGLVMMYVQYPSVSEEERLAGLAELDLGACCRWPGDFSNIELDSFRLEMLDGRPIIRLAAQGDDYTLDLQRGEYVDGFTEAQAAGIAASIAEQLGDGLRARYLGPVDRDQWTVAGGFSAHRPLHRFELDDGRGTQIYLSSYSGEAVQMTTASERFWNWLGSVVHWLYPTVIRQNAYLWSQAIIWTSSVGLLLTAVGLYIGIRQFRCRRSGRHSAYRGVWLWHHYAGLIFGVLTLTWLFSGLLSVQPWGAFESRSFAAENARLKGRTLALADVQLALRDASSMALPRDTVQLEGARFGGGLFALAWTQDARATRLAGSEFAAAPLTDDELAAAAARLRPDASIVEQGWLARGDAYYYEHHDARRFPVYRIRYGDDERIYLDGTSGQLAYTVDDRRRSLRWLFLALHRGDFAAVVRERPVWDVMMWLAMSGVTVGALTGTWLGARRVVRAVRGLRARRPSPWFRAGF
jgi:hypothetical protein